MEYWEGFFLGEHWTDSDFFDRKHGFLFFVISFLVFLLTIAKIIFPGRVAFLFHFSWPFNLMIGLFLLFTLPFAAARYYRLPFALRLLVLLLYIIQYGTLVLAFIQILVSLLNLDLGSLSTVFMEMFDQIMGFSAGIFEFLGSFSSTLATVAGAIVIGGLVGLSVILLSILAPLLYIYAFRCLQRTVDFLLYQKILAK